MMKLFTAFLFAGVIAFYASHAVLAQTSTGTPTPTTTSTMTATPTPTGTAPAGAPNTGYGTMR